MPAPILTVTQVAKRYGDVTAVADVSLTVGAGEIVCLLGPSGCGKTTLLRLIAGLETADRGQIAYAGQDLAGAPPHRRDFGLMFQDFALFPHLSVGENIAYGLRMRGIARPARDARVAEMLALVELPGYAARNIDQLSGGERQRVALARALAPRPRLLLLDEPLGALDRALRERLMVEVRAILRRVGVTSLYVTHDQTEAYAVADRIAVLNAGRLEQIDAPETLYRRPRTAFVARFLGLENLLPGRATAEGVQTALGMLPVAHDSAPGAAVTLLIRPDAVAWAEPSAPDDGLSLTGVLRAHAFRGRYYQVWIAVGETIVLGELTDLDGRRDGETVRVRLDPAGCRPVDASGADVA